MARVQDRRARFASAARLACAVLAFALSACAGHSSRTLEARSALDAGRPAEALEFYNEELEVENEKELPADVSGENALLLLDRAIILQELRQYELSARDLQVADKEIDLLDLKRGTLDDIGKYMFSDDTGPYKAPAYERLMINTLNIVNYLVKRDLSGARVEARRLAVIQKYIKEYDHDSSGLLGPGSYLAGFVFEKSGEPQSALRYYDEALQYGDVESLRGPIVRLASEASYRTPRITKVLEGAGGAESPPPESDDAELLVIINYGRVPAKEAKRIPIGLALTYASGAISPYNRSRANALAAQGLVTWVNYPELGKTKGQWGQPRFELDGQPRALDVSVPIDLEVKKAWEASRGAVVASAITRMISRVVAGEATRKATGGGVAGLLVSLGTQATLTAVDTPDTRSWSTLPARIAIGRMRVKPGEHTVELSVRGRQDRFKVNIKPKDWAVVNLTVLR